jgi:hypothetical protein
LKWRLQALLFNSLNQLELDSKPPSLNPLSYSNFLAPPEGLNVCRNSSDEIRVGYAILVWERFEYLSDVIESLLNSRLDGINVTFFIIDDGSIDKRVREFLLEIKLKYNSLDIQIYFEEHLNGTAGSVINRAVKIMTNADNFDVLGWGDPDCIYNQEWLINSLELFKFARKNSKHKVRVFTSYNSATTLNLHKVIDKMYTPGGEILLRHQFGMANVLIYLDDLREIGLFHETPDDESIFIKRLTTLGFVGACPLEGLIEHIGEHSALNSDRPVSLPRADFSMQLRKEGWPVQILSYTNLSIEKHIKSPIETPIFSLDKIDIAITLHPKDFPTLPIVVKSLRLFLKHPIGEIFLISQISPESQRLASDLELDLIDEDIFFAHKYNYDLRKTGYIDRTGWLRQQFIKLSVNEIGKSENILVIDGDTVLLKDQAFIRDRKNLIQFSDEYHPPYFQSYLRIFGRSTGSKISCITHKMLFNKQRLTEMKQEIEDRFNLPWHKAIYLCSDLTSPSGFSEYELYGHWIMQNYPEEVFTNFWSNTALDQSKLKSVSSLSQELGGEYETVSFHKYLI